MSVFDAHVHLHGDGSSYDLEVLGRNIIFNDVASFQAFAASGQRAEGDAITLILALGAERPVVEAAARAGDIDALKIHSRIQQLDETGWIAAGAALAELPPALPVVIDAFYYGKDLRFQPSLSAIIGLLDEYSDRTFIIAHCGGYRILEYFFHLREFENCIYDLSFSLQYLADSSLRADLKKLLRYTDKARLLFGSDYPYASPSAQLAVLREIAEELQLTRDEMDAISARNAMRVFGKDLPAWIATK